MNYQGFAEYTNRPPEYGQKKNKAYYDSGQGVPQLNKNNMTIQDIYRTPFLFTNAHNTDFGGMGNAAIKGIQSNSDLSKLYFSDENMKRLQKQIKNEIFLRTGGEYKIDTDQDGQDLFIVMRSIYMEHAKFLENGIVRQVKELNRKVIEEVVPGIMVNIQQYHGYLKEINGPLKPIDRPVNVGNAGRKILPSVFTTFQ